MLSIILQSVDMLSVGVQSVDILSVGIQSVDMLSVVMLQCLYTQHHYASLERGPCLVLNQITLD
jgi:hypothetical protein